MSETLFAPIKLRELTIRNRIFMSPMCQYSAVNGVPNNWHLVHLGTRAAGGVGMVTVEATSISPEGRISSSDLGLWNHEQLEAFKPIVQFIKSQGATPAIQLAHAGRKASTKEPWKGSGAVPVSEGGWQPIAPSAVAFDPSYHMPREMNESDIHKVIEDFRASAQMALNAGFEVAEVHMAHGYLMHEFLSPLSNHRKDQFGGSLENRMRLPLMVAKSVREVWPARLPLFVRISASDWMPDAWDVKQSVTLCRELKKLGIDLIDVSSGGLVPHAKIPGGEPHYQVPFAEEIRRDAGIAVGAVGMITDPVAAQGILSSGKADAVFLARELLRNPYWPAQAAKALGEESKLSWPNQYGRAR